VNGCNNSKTSGHSYCPNHTCINPACTYSKITCETHQSLNLAEDDRRSPYYR